MLHLLSAAPAPTAPSTCPSVSLFEGLRYELPAGHQGAHASGARVFARERSSAPATSQGSAVPPAAPPVDAPPAAPASPTPLERVLRLAALSLPCMYANPAVAKLERVAADLRGLRSYYLHHVETCSAIDAWLELYAGRP